MPKNAQPSAVLDRAQIWSDIRRRTSLNQAAIEQIVKVIHEYIENRTTHSNYLRPSQIKAELKRYNRAVSVLLNSHKAMTEDTYGFLISSLNVSLQEHQLWTQELKYLSWLSGKLDTLLEGDFLNGKGGTPEKHHKSILALRLIKLLRQEGQKATSAAGGELVALLEILLQAAGESPAGARSLASKALKCYPRTPYLLT